MVQENKELLFKDLCSRIPYHVCVKIWLNDGTTEEGPLDLQHNYADVLLSAFYYSKIVDIKPYLRPMSSMTEEEANEWAKASNMQFDMEDGFFDAYDAHLSVDWLNAHHFDYRGLIEKGLALKAKEGMYKN